ncbi:hypothetical protein FA95DRAFT_1603774 [Auriscalpium vulgare]|uniref:Uncharacterized protein n=1 Tax=Auriscalpium vulgare TaxID=40419 RepID=A0ACB8S2M8_9AGAM|nr:hypothetical protein FA95DRAFT_1603774 [Auriscalpium vulgare]
MADLTVLYEPHPVRSRRSGLRLLFNGKPATPPLLTPVSKVTPMITLEFVDDALNMPRSPLRARDDALLSPPTRSSSRRPPRPASAPPESPSARRTTFSVPVFPLPRPRSRASSPCRAPPELVRPAPPLLRPQAFWRHNARSDNTTSCCAQSVPLVRRSTFIAAGLDMKRPYADLSVFAVESRIDLVTLPPV